MLKFGRFFIMQQFREKFCLYLKCKKHNYDGRAYFGWMSH